MCVCNKYNQRKIGYQLENGGIWEEFEERWLKGSGGVKEGESDVILFLEKNLKILQPQGNGI